MRDAVTDDDLAVDAARQQLALLPQRRGYAAAMASRSGSNAGRIGAAVGAVGSSALVWASWSYVTAAWLMYVLIAVFGLLAGALVLMVIGLSAQRSFVRWGVVVIAKPEPSEPDGDYKVKLLRESGDQVELAVSSSLYKLLRAGDLGVATVDVALTPNTLETFERL